MLIWEHDSRSTGIEATCSITIWQLGSGFQDVEPHCTSDLVMLVALRSGRSEKHCHSRSSTVSHDSFSQSVDLADLMTEHRRMGDATLTITA
ncbi:hypothetical protein LIA77_05625 [Sarocladium implicatum]|nr:hypothetical protein LIA77_05625 [Sarocladium implicatum]